MSIVNLTSDYDSAPYTPEPDPFANYVEPNGSPTTANYQAWGTPAPVNTPAPYVPQAPAPPAEPTYNYQYDTWQDADGRLWDRNSGLWYSISDPNNPLVYRPQVGWQSPAQYNDYNKVLSEFGTFAQDPVVAQPSVFNPQQLPRQLTPAEWQQIDNYKTNQRLVEAMPGLQEHDQFQYATREDNINRLMQGGYTREEAQSLPDSVAEERARLMDRVQYARDQGQGASLSDILGGLLAPAAQGLGLLNKYVSAPVEETLSQLTPLGLSLLKHEMPGLALPFAAADALTGYNPDTRVLGGLRDLGSAAKDSGGNPLTFADIQNKNMAERPMGEQLAAQLLYDPVNLVGAGLGAKALESGALEGGSLLSSIVRTAAGFDKAAEAAQAAVFKPLGAALTPIGRTLATEEGSAVANIAARIGLTVGAGSLGYATSPEDASQREKWLRALGFAAVPAALPESTDIIAKLYGKLPFLAEEGLSRKGWMDVLPEQGVLREAGVTPPIRLPEVKPGESLPASAKISNTAWKLVGDRKNLDLAEIQPMMAAFSDAEQRIPMVADDLVKTAGDDYVRTVKLSDEGYFLGKDGKPLPLLDTATGEPVMLKLSKESDELTPVFAGARDVSDRLPVYEAKGLVTPEQVNAIKKLGEVTSEIRPAQAAFGLAPEPTPTVMDGGVYISRGVGRTSEKAPRFKNAAPADITRPGASQARKWTSEGEAILLGNLKYDHPIEAMQKYVREGLGQLNEANLTANLSNVKIESALSGKPVSLGDLRVDKGVQKELKDTIKTVQETKAELKKLKTRQSHVDRDVRLGSKWVEQADRRIGKLTSLASDQSLKAASREKAATDAYELAKQGFKDAESAARDYMKQTGKLAGKESQVRAELRQTVNDARGLANQVEDRLKDATTAERLDNLNYITDTWGHADAIRQAVAADIDALSTKLEGLPLEQRQAAMAEVKDALSTARNSFNDSLTTIRQQKKAAEQALVQQTKAVDNVRAALTEGRVKELERMAEQRADSLKTSLTYSKELQDKVDELKAKLLPLEQHRDELKDVLKQSKVFRDELRKSSVPTGTIQIGEGWKDVPVPVEIANAVNKYRIDPGAQRGTLHMVGRVLDGMNTVARFMGATGDISRTAIQGLLGIGEDPSITRKGIVAGFKAVKDPEHEWTYLKNLEAERVKEGFPGIARLVGRGNLEIAHNEYLFRGVSGDNGLLAKLAQKRPLSWFETLFSTPGNIERLERAYAYLDVAKMQGKNVMDDKVMREAAAAANMVTGRSAHSALHPLLNDRQASRVLFAGRFVQSQIDTIYNAIMVGGIEGEVARRSLSRLAIGGLALTYMINEALGEKTDWNPVKDGMPNPNFARVRVAGHDVSLFGPWDSLMRGAVQTYMDGGNPSQFLRSKLAPVPGLGWDLSVGGGKTFMGDKIGLNRQTFDQYLPTPFGITDAAKEWIGAAQGKESPLDAVAGTALNILGMKNSPLSPREKYNEKLSDAYPDWTPPVAYQKPDDPFTDPLFLRDYAAKHKDEVPGPASQLGKQMQSIRDQYAPDLQKNTENFQNDKKTLGQWKDDRSDLKLKLRAALEPIQAQMKAAFGDKAPEPGTPAAWVDSYMETFNKATVDGVLDKKLLDKYQAEWLAANGPQAQDYIDQYFLAGTDQGPEREYLTAMQQLNKDGYFDGGIPRYINMTSGMSDDQIAEARALIDGKWEAYPQLQGADYSLKALTILRPLGYSMQQILDVGNSGKKAYENPKYTIYKMKHPDLMEWLDNGNFYSTIQAVTARTQQSTQP